MKGGELSDIDEENSLCQFCLCIVDAISLVLECNTRAVCVVVWWRLWLSSVCVTCFYSCLGFLAWHIAVHTLKTMKSVLFTCECTHGEQDIDCEVVMVAGVGKDTSVP